MAQGTLDVTTGLQKRTNPSKIDRLLMVNPETEEPQYIEMDQVTGQVRGDMLPAFNLDNIRVMTSTAPDNKIIKSNVLDPLTGQYRTFKELDFTPPAYDGRLFMQAGGKDWGDADFLVNRTFNVVKMGGDNTGVNFSDDALNKIKSIYQDGDKIIFPHGDYKFQNTHTFTKSVDIDFGNSTITCSGIDGFIFTGVEKSTHTVTVDYIEGLGNNSLTLNNTVGILKGDIINVISTELYDSSRTYNYKGGNFLVTSVVGNVVYFNGFFPFDISATSIEVKIYKPSKVKVMNIGKITNDNIIDNTLYGIRLIHCSNSLISECTTGEFRYNVDIYRCVSVMVLNVTTGHAKKITDTFEGYGIAIESSSNVICTNVKTDSGQHGITNGGREVCCNLTFNDCVLKSEDGSAGFGAHANLYNATFNSCTFFGSLFSGNCTMNDCEFITQNSGIQGNITTMDSPKYANYIFNRCRIRGVIRLRDTAQVMTAGRKYVGNIVFNQCTGVNLATEVSLLTTIGKIAEIDKIEVNGGSGFKLFIKDKVNNLRVISAEKALDDRGITMDDVSGRLCEAKNVHLENMSVAGGAYAVGFRLRNCKNVYINNIICPDGNSPTTYPGEIFGAENLVIENTDASNVPRPFNLSGISKMRVINSDINSTNSTQFTTFIKEATELHTDGLKKVLDGEVFNIRMGDGGKRYNQTINSAGAMVLTEIVP